MATHKQKQALTESQLGLPIPDDVLESIDHDVEQAGGEWKEVDEVVYKELEFLVSPKYANAPA